VLSLTSYELELAKLLPFEGDDPEILQSLKANFEEHCAPVRTVDRTKAVSSGVLLWV
jgi:hypothetical protein